MLMRARYWVFCLLVVGCGGKTDLGAAPGDAGGNVGLSDAPCVDVSHVNAMQRRDLRVVGSGFDTYDGFMMRVLVTLGEPEYGLGEEKIEHGAFDIRLPHVLADYTGIGLLADAVRDGACNPRDGEFIWQVTSGPLSSLGPIFTVGPSGEAVWNVTPEARYIVGWGRCDINGIFDMTKPIGCGAR